MPNAGIGAFLNRLRGLSFVTRWNFHPITRRQTVADHSFWVAIYAMMIADLSEITAPIEHILRAALLHDMEEAVTGDLPSLVKRTIGVAWDEVEKRGAKQLVGDMWLRYDYWWRYDNEDLRKIVKAADILDRVMYAEEEQMRGNQAFDRIKLESIKQLRDMHMSSVDLILDELGYKGAGGVDLPKDMTHL